MFPPMEIEFATGICNWNLQLECNWNATAGNCTEEYVTGKTHAVVVLVKMVLFHYSRIAR